MGVTGQHLEGFVPADGPDLHHVEIRLLEKARDGLMPEERSDVFSEGAFSKFPRDLVI